MTKCSHMWRFVNFPAVVSRRRSNLETPHFTLYALTHCTEYADAPRDTGYVSISGARLLSKIPMYYFTHTKKITLHDLRKSAVSAHTDISKISPSISNGAQTATLPWQAHLTKHICDINNTKYFPLGEPCARREPQLSQVSRISAATRDASPSSSSIMQFPRYNANISQDG